MTAANPRAGVRRRSPPFRCRQGLRRRVQSGAVGYDGIFLRKEPPLITVAKLNRRREHARYVAAVERGTDDRRNRARRLPRLESCADRGRRVLRGWRRVRMGGYLSDAGTVGGLTGRKRLVAVVMRAGVL
jgi:hypothetical protein